MSAIRQPSDSVGLEAREPLAHGRLLALENPRDLRDRIAARRQHHRPHALVHAPDLASHVLVQRAPRGLAQRAYEDHGDQPLTNRQLASPAHHAPI
jgi:hypothetical protein